MSPLRRRAEDRDEDEATARELLAALPTPLLAVDEAGCVRLVNAAAEAMLLLSRTALLGRSIAALIGWPLHAVPAETPVVAYGEELTLAGGRAVCVDMLVAPWPERAGWRIVVMSPHPSAAPIARRGGRRGGAVAAAGAAAILAHEIKNPLAGIRGAAQLVEASVDAEARALTRLIRDEVDRIAALVDRVESFGDTRALALAPQNIHAILGHARAVASAGLPAEIVFREDYDPSLPPVLGHRDSLVQVLINLIKNAAEALGPGGGTITLATAYRHGVAAVTDDGGRRGLPIEVRVIDDGPGAPAGIAEHLFDPFVTSRPGGKGLGLALVHKLVADQGGIVDYAREGRPPRTVFRLMLPRAEDRAS